MTILSRLHRTTISPPAPNTKADRQYQANRHAVPKWFSWALLAAAVVKMLLVSNEEIIAYDLPHDDLWQITAADAWYWLGDYRWDTLLHLPIYPLLIKIVSLTGVPLRVATDLLFCSTSWLFAVALRRLGCAAAVSLLAGVAAMFHPASFQLPNRCGAEILLTPLLMGGVSASIIWWAGRNSPNSWRYAVGASCWWALAWNIRKESILLVGFFGLLGVLIVGAEKGRGLKHILTRVALGLGTPITASLFISLAISSGNFLRWHIFTKSILTAPGYTAAYKALQSVPPSRPLDYIAVPAATRDQIYAVSPTFAELRPHLEGPVGAKWAQISRAAFTDPLGMRDLGAREIATGWFYWALHDVAIAAGHVQAKDEDQFFYEIAEDIRKAQTSGILGSRWVPVAFLDPAWDRWLPRFAGSFSSVSSLLLSPAVTQRPLQDATNSLDVATKFDSVATRRAHLLRQPTALLSGWAVISKGKIESLSLVSPSGTIAHRTHLSTIRPDISASTPSGINIECTTISPADWLSSSLQIEIENRGFVTIPVKELEAGKVISRSQVDQTVTVAFDVISRPSTARHWTWAIQTIIERQYLSILKLSQWLLLLFPVTILYAQFQKIPLRIEILPIILISSLILARLLFFSMLDASSWPGNQPRYIYPILPLHGALLALIVGHVVATFMPSRLASLLPQHNPA